MVFPVVMYGCESWTVKKAEHRRIDAFELWCWRVSWTARRSNQSVLKEINPECSLEELILKLKFQHFSHLMWRADSLEDPDAGKGWRQKEKGAAEDETDSILSKLWEIVKDMWEPGLLQSVGLQRVRHDLVTEQQRKFMKKTKVVMRQKFTF